jgi:hypothetical protein
MDRQILPGQSKRGDNADWPAANDENGPLRK